MSANTQSEGFERFMATVTMLAGAMVARQLTDAQKTNLGGALPRDVIKTRQQAGQSLKYVEGWYVIERLNEVFGFDGWSFDPGVPVVTSFGDKSVVHVSVMLRACGVERGDVGAAVSAGKTAEAFETALKAAVTDGLKRAARTFGTTFGNRLYDKVGSGIGISTKAMAMLDELEEARSVDAVNVWVKANGAAVGKLDRDEQDIIKGACATRRREIVSEGVEPAAPTPAPDPPVGPSPALAECLERIAAIELPGEAVAVWMKHAAALAALPANDGETGWKALLEQTKRVGKMSNPGAWIRKAIAEEDARNQRTTWTPAEEPTAAPVTAANAPSPVDRYRARLAAAPTLDAFVATVMELMPTIGAFRDEASDVAAERSAELGAKGKLPGLVGAAEKITKDPQHWAVVAKVLSGLHTAQSKEAVAEVVRVHAAAASKVPQALKNDLNEARKKRLAALAAPANDVAALIEGELRAAATIPDLDMIAEKVERELKAGRLSAAQARALVTQHEQAAAALERNVA